MKKPLLGKQGRCQADVFADDPVRAGCGFDSASGVLARTRLVLTVAGQRRICTGLPPRGCKAIEMLKKYKTPSSSMQILFHNEPRWENPIKVRRIRQFPESKPPGGDPKASCSEKVGISHILQETAVFYRHLPEVLGNAPHLSLSFDLLARP